MVTKSTRSENSYNGPSEGERGQWYIQYAELPVSNIHDMFVWVAILSFLLVRKLVCYTHVFPCNNSSKARQGGQLISKKEAELPGVGFEPVISAYMKIVRCNDF